MFGFILYFTWWALPSAVSLIFFGLIVFLAVVESDAELRIWPSLAIAAMELAAVIWLLFYFAHLLWSFWS